MKAAPLVRDLDPAEPGLRILAELLTEAAEVQRQRAPILRVVRDEEEGDEG